MFLNCFHSPALACAINRLHHTALLPSLPIVPFVGQPWVLNAVFRAAEVARLPRHTTSLVSTAIACSRASGGQAIGSTADVLQAGLGEERTRQPRRTRAMRAAQPLSCSHAINYDEVLKLIIA